MTSIYGEIIPGHFEVAGCYMDVSENSGFSPKSSILKRFSIIFTIHFGVPLFLETPICFFDCDMSSSSEVDPRYLLKHIHPRSNHTKIHKISLTEPGKNQGIRHDMYHEDHNFSPKLWKAPEQSMVWRPLGFWGPAYFQGLSSPNLQQSLKNGIKWPCLNDN